MMGADVSSCALRYRMRSLSWQWKEVKGKGGRAGEGIAEEGKGLKANT